MVNDQAVRDATQGAPLAAERWVYTKRTAGWYRPQGWQPLNLAAK